MLKNKLSEDEIDSSKQLSLDENKILIDSIINDYIVPSAIIVDNLVSQKSETTLEISNLQISDVSFLVFTTELSTSNINDFVDIYSDYNLEVILSGEIIQTLGKWKKI